MDITMIDTLVILLHPADMLAGLLIITFIVQHPAQPTGLEIVRSPFTLACRLLRWVRRALAAARRH